MRMGYWSEGSGFFPHLQGFSCFFYEIRGPDVWYVSKYNCYILFSFFLISNKKIVIIISNSYSFCVGFLYRFPLVLVSFLCCNKIPAQTQFKGERVLLTHSYSLSLWACQGSRKLKLLVTFHSQLTAVINWHIHSQCTLSLSFSPGHSLSNGATHIQCGSLYLNGPKLRKSLTDMPIGQSRQSFIDTLFQLILDCFKVTSKTHYYTFVHPIFS